MSRKKQLKEDFQNILTRWKEALDLPETEISRDAAILRFELTFEVGWKLMQILAREEGYEVNSPRKAFQQAFTMGWITDEVIWTDILKARNTATHVYREQFAQSLYNDLSDFYEAFKEFGDTID